MLTIDRRERGVIRIGENIRLKVLAVNEKNGEVHLKIDAPASTRIKPAEKCFDMRHSIKTK